MQRIQSRQAQNENSLFLLQGGDYYYFTYMSSYLWEKILETKFDHLLNIHYVISGEDQYVCDRHSGAVHGEG